MAMNALDWIAFALVVIGGLNWGLFAFGYNLVELILGTGRIAKIIYIFVGLSAIYSVIRISLLKG